MEIDLVFGSSAEHRAVAEVYTFDDSEQTITTGFGEARTKVMNLNRFDLDRS